MAAQENGGAGAVPAPSLAEHAAGMADGGYFVFPVRWKTPLTKHGFKDATNDPDRARELFADSRATGIGVDCGRSRLLVVDVDGPVGWGHWLELGGEDGTTLSATTGRPHGYHLYFRTEGAPPRSKRLAEQLETKGTGGYSICPPSAHSGGGRYEWVWWWVPPAPAPEWLLDLHRPDRPPAAAGVRRTVPLGEPLTRYGAAALQGLLADVMVASQGTRNSTLHKAARRAGRLAAAGELAPELAKEKLLAAADLVGLPYLEAERTIESGFNFGMQYPARRSAR